jgi:hypothetical protein
MLTLDARHEKTKVGYNVVLNRGGQYNIIMSFGNKAGSCPEFLQGFNIDPDGRLLPGDRLWLLAIALTPKHRICCSSAELVFKDDVPPPNPSLTLSM